MAHKDYQIYATDSLIDRNRFGRNMTALSCLLLTFLIPFLGAKVTSDWFGWASIGLFLGLVGQAFVIKLTLHRFIVQVGELRAFVTIDQLRTLSGSHTTNQERKDDGDVKAYVVYGPGFHISYPWESRGANRNVPLEEVGESFAVEVQTPKGNLNIKGSVRLRPDIKRVIPFLGGVAVMASDITDLIKTVVIGDVSKKRTIKSALSSVPKMNEKLSKTFGENVTEFEERFGVSVGDVTISQILPSPELQKTMTGLSEAEIIADGAAITAGFPGGAKDARQAINDGRLTQADLNEARDRFMAASDNIKMNLDANEYRIKLEGLEKLDPNVAQAILTLGPVLARMAGQGQQKSQRRK